MLMVEDNPGDVRLVREALSGVGQMLAVHAVSSGEEALAFLRRENDYACAPRPALVLLDLNLPGISGLEVLAKIDVDPDLRAIPVVMLTSSDAESDVRAAYAQRVNCFITKPVDLELLLDWLRGVVNSAGPSVKKPVLELGTLRMDTQALKVWHDGAPVKVSPTEYRILHYLVINNDRPVSAEELVNHNFEGDTVKTANEVPVFISRLRDKLGKTAIETVFGYGYRLTIGGEPTPIGDEIPK